MNLDLGFGSGTSTFVVYQMPLCMCSQFDCVLLNGQRRVETAFEPYIRPSAYIHRLHGSYIRSYGPAARRLIAPLRICSYMCITYKHKRVVAMAV